MKEEKLRVILCPGYIRSKYDGETHFIGVSDLMRLYNVKRTDVIRVAENKGLPRGMSEAQVLKEKWLILEPRYDEDLYYDIHH